VDFARTSGTARSGTDYTWAPGTLSFAAGQSSRTISVALANDSTREPAETLVVSLRNPGTATTIGRSSTTLAVAASDQRPDGWISTTSSSGFVGNNIYGTTGSQQTATLKGRRAQERTFYVRVYNDGNVTNTIALRAGGAQPGRGSGTTGAAPT